MRFTRVTLGSLALLIALGGILFWSLIYIRPGDEIAYMEMMEENRTMLSKKALEETPATQKRLGVQKDIWSSKAKERLHVRLKSESSDLKISQSEKHLTATETLKAIDCWVQESIDEEGQQVRHFTSESGIYYFPEHKFVASEVNIAFFRLPGRELPTHIPSEAPYLSGVAKEASFSIAKNLPAFRAYHLKAEFTSP